MPTATAPVDKRPCRRLSETGHEQIVERVEPDGSRWRLVLRQVGWIGQSGAFYSLDEDPAPTEPGSFTPLWFVAHGDRISDTLPSTDEELFGPPLVVDGGISL